uniref:Uncharacterized protein n=1 Tax=Arundo donax TaxID=35708 RepID=A0A0A8ZTD9_ARUDO
MIPRRSSSSSCLIMNFMAFFSRSNLDGVSVGNAAAQLMLWPTLSSATTSIGAQLFTDEDASTRTNAVPFNLNVRK